MKLKLSHCSPKRRSPNMDLPQRMASHVAGCMFRLHKEGWEGLFGCDDSFIQNLRLWAAFKYLEWLMCQTWRFPFQKATPGTGRRFRLGSPRIDGGVNDARFLPWTFSGSVLVFWRIPLIPQIMQDTGPRMGWWRISHFRNKQIQFEGRTQTQSWKRLAWISSDLRIWKSIFSWSSFGEQKSVTICSETRWKTDILLLVVISGVFLFVRSFSRHNLEMKKPFWKFHPVYIYIDWN